jgi:peptide/nickel transport system substrate-binding protein
MHKSSIRGAVAAALAAGLALCAAVPAHAQARKQITAAMSAEVAVLDPHFSTNYTTRDFAYMVFDTLFTMDSKGVIRPQMVDSYQTSADGLTWNFKLRDGLAFHDGAPVTAADAVASIKRWGSRDGLGKQLMAATKSLDALDAKSFRLVLAKPFGLVLDALGKPSSLVPAIMPERLAKTPATTQVSEIVGSGPFVFKRDQWISGEKMVFEKNTAYKPRAEPADGLAGGKVVKVDRVEWRTIADASTSINALAKGEIDWVEQPPLDLLPTLRKNPAVKISSTTGTNMWQGMVRFNHASGPFADPEIRRVVWLAIDQSEVAPAFGATEELSLKSCHTFFICGGPYDNATGAEIARRPSLQEARAALKKTRYKGEPVVILQASNVESLRVSGDVVAQKLRDVGFNVDLQTMDWGSLVARRGKKEGWAATSLYQHGFDASSPVTHFYISTNCGQAPGWSCDARLTPLLEQFAAAGSLDERKKLASQMQGILYENTPFVIWGQFSQPRAYRASLKGVISSSIPAFWNIEK